MSIRLKFCGGAKTVTGSMHLLKTSQSQVLIDGGLFQGRRDDFYKINTSYAFNPAEITALALSHAHIDHSGNIPNLVKHGLSAPIYATTATVDLCGLMLPDSGHIQEEDIKFVNKINQKKGRPLREPLYTEVDARTALGNFRGGYYRKPIRITPDVTCTFYEAGHVLGAALMLFEIENGKPVSSSGTNRGSGRTIRLAYAVDLGRKNLPLLRDPDVINDIDYLIIESTYGNREHEPVASARQKLADVINRTIKRGGKIIIPSFAFERTQEVVYFLTELIRNGRVPEIPVFVDSPLASNITRVFQDHTEYMDDATRQLLAQNKDPFGFNYINYIRSKEESIRLNDDRRPMVIISASGMCEAGRILHHLRNNIANPANTVLVVGYMAQNTLGKKIVDRQPVVKIFGEEHPLNAEVVKINAFSAHADMTELMNYIRQCGKSIKRIFVVHGDEDQSEPFTRKLEQSGYKSFLPSRNEEVVLG